MAHFGGFVGQTFDSEACFASLLGTEAHGFWSISPKSTGRVDRRYIPGTLIVEPAYSQTSGAVVSVTDFMTIGTKYSCVARIVRASRRTAMLRAVSLLASTMAPLKQESKPEGEAGGEWFPDRID